jgi:hypothetical protein
MKGHLKLFSGRTLFHEMFATVEREGDLERATKAFTKQYRPKWGDFPGGRVLFQVTKANLDRQHLTSLATTSYALPACAFSHRFSRCCGGLYATTSTARSKRNHASDRIQLRVLAWKAP